MKSDTRSIKKTEIPKKLIEKIIRGGIVCSFERGGTGDKKEILAEDCHLDIKRLRSAAFVADEGEVRNCVLKKEMRH